MGDSPYHDANDFLNPHKHKQYELNSTIMLTVIISISLVVALVTILHLYARCLLRRQTRRRAALSQLRMAVIIPEPPKNGLDPAIIATLPIFPFRQTNGTAQQECTICLSVLESEDMIRMLPNCKHNFHADCVDKWLLSNSTCPVCRSQVEPAAIHPSAPPMVEGSTSENGNQNHGKNSNGSSSRLSSFRRILSRERSSLTIQHCGHEAGLEDLERQ